MRTPSADGARGQDRLGPCAAAGSAPAPQTSNPERARPPAPRRHGPRRRGDRGSVSLWVVIFAFTTIGLLVLVVDGGQAMNAKSRAADIAEQAARAAADDVNVADLRAAAGTVQFAAGFCDKQAGPAAQLVADYAKGVPGATAKLINCTPGTTVVGGTAAPSVTAEVVLSVRPSLPVPPFTTISATATETAYVACGSADQREVC